MDEPCIGYGLSSSVWYSYTPRRNGTLALSTSRSYYTTVAAVYDASNSSEGMVGLVRVSSQYGCNGYGGCSSVTVSVFAGVPYAIQVDASVSQGGGEETAVRNTAEGTCLTRNCTVQDDECFGHALCDAAPTLAACLAHWIKTVSMFLACSLDVSVLSSLGDRVTNACMMNVLASPANRRRAPSQDAARRTEYSLGDVVLTLTLTYVPTVERLTMEHCTAPALLLP